VILLAPHTTGPLMRVPVSGGELTTVTSPSPEQGGHRWPVALPDGRRFIFFSRGELHLGALDTPSTVLTASDGSGIYLANAPSNDAADEHGWLVWPRGGNLMARQLDPARGVLIGEPVMLSSSVAVSSTLLTAVSASATGRLAYRATGGVTKQLTWRDRSGKILGTLGRPGANELRHPAIAPNDRRVVVTRTVQNNTDVWLLDDDRISRLTFDAAADRHAVWSPDGSRAVFQANRNGTGNLYEKLTSGLGEDVPVVTSDQDKTPTSWSPNGAFLLYYSIDPQSGDDLWVVRMKRDRDMAANATASVFLRTPYRELAAQFSPDGRWVAYMSNESGRMEVYVRPFADPESTGRTGVAGQWQISAEGGVYPRWRRDGKEIYFLNLAGDMMAARVALDEAILQAGAPVRLFQQRVFVDGISDNVYDLSADGRFLINTVIENNLAPLTLLMNWKGAGVK
jgi:hypothetical protein